MAAPSSYVAPAPRKIAGRPPPHDLEAEKAVLSTLLLDVRRLVKVQLRPSDFYSEAHGLIFSAIVELAGAERPVDTVTVAGLLQDRQRLASIGGAAYLAHIEDETPSVANVGAHAERVAALAHRRRVIAQAHRIAAEGYGDVPEGWEQDAARTLAEIARPMVETKPDLALADVDALFAPLPPVPYLVPRLDMCPGAPTLFAGYGFSGKTLAAQSLALSVAAGGPVWGSVSLARQGRVIHLDYEQGLRLTAERYQRLARARDITAEELRGRLAVAALPSMHLSAAGAVDAFSRACEGAALLIVDSLRACAPDLDENSSEVRRLLDALLAVSERTGVVPLVIHHARKPRDDDGGGAKTAIRGSSAIFDACSSVLVFSASKGEPVLVQHEKARTSGVTSEDLALEIRDVGIGDDARAGVEVHVVGVAPPKDRKAKRDEARRADLHDRIVAFVGRHPGCSGRAVRGADLGVKAGDNTITDALAFLALEGRLRRAPGPRHSEAWFATSPSPEVAQ